MNKRSEWLKIHSTRPNGHAFFKHPDGLCVADCSGSTPDRTDDGPLWVNEDAVDRCRAIVVDLGEWAAAAVPVFTSDGDSKRVLITVEDAAWFASYFEKPLMLRTKEGHWFKHCSNPIGVMAGEVTS